MHCDTLPLKIMLALPLLAACGPEASPGQWSAEATEACVPGAYAIVVDGPLNVRAEPGLETDVLGQANEGAALPMGVAPAVEAEGHTWINVMRGTRPGWVASGYVACRLPDLCPAGQERHGFVKRDDTTEAYVYASPDPASELVRILPFGQRVIVREQHGEFVAVVVPSFDESGTSDRLEGFMRADDLARDMACREDGLAQKELIGAMHLLGQYELVVSPGGNNSKNYVLGFNRVDGGTAAHGTAFDYLERIIPPNDVNNACASNDDCAADHVCRLATSENDDQNDNRCSRYYNGGTNSGGVAWASGVCGTATITHRAALDASLLPLEYTTHYNFPGKYLYPGADAEVWWSASQRQNYRFFNDSGGELAIVTGSRIGTEADAGAGDASGSPVGRLIVSMQIWGSALDRRYSEYVTLPSSSVAYGNTGAPNDAQCLELVRDLTRIGDGRRTSPPFTTYGSVDGHPGLASIRLVSVEEEPTADGETATTERWHITSCYSSAYPGDPTPKLSRSHPENL